MGGLLEGAVRKRFLDSIAEILPLLINKDLKKLKVIPSSLEKLGQECVDESTSSFRTLVLRPACSSVRRAA